MTPTPHGQVPSSSAVLKAIREANMQLVHTGDDEFMLVTYKNAKAQCDGGKCGIGGYCDDCPAPQADSQPAMTPETVYAAIAHGDEEHRAWLLSALRAVWCGEAVPPVASPIANAAAESQPAPEYVGNGMFKGETIKKAAEHWANWCDRRCMTGLSEFLRVVASRVQADSVLEDAARWQWLADYLIGERTDLDEGIVACATIDALRQFSDAARKQGGA